MSQEEVRAPHLFTLTKITGRRRTDDRTTVVSSFEFNRRHFNVFLIGLIPTAIITGIAATLIGIYSLLVSAVVMVAWFWLVERRSKSGLQTRTWQTIVDKKKTLSGQFIQSGVLITDEHFSDYQVLGASVPITRVSLADEASGLVAGQDPLPAAVMPQPVATATPAPARRRAGRPQPVLAEAAPSNYDLDDVLPGGSS